MIAAVKLIEGHENRGNPRALTGAFGQITHFAYHLGAIRQIMKQIGM